VSMKDVAQRRSTNNVPTGNCFGMVVQEEKHRIKSVNEPIASWLAFVAFRVASCCFRAGIFSES
jgi:hypothetical protein